MLKLLFHCGTTELSTSAARSTFKDQVFNAPTLAEADKVAALDGLNRL